MSDFVNIMVGTPLTRFAVHIAGLSPQIYSCVDTGMLPSDRVVLMRAHSGRNFLHQWQDIE